MPRYHFNVFDGVAEIDEDGIQLAGANEARVEGMRLAGALLAEEATRNKYGKDWRLEVTDGGGMILFRIDIMLSQSAAMG